MTADASSTSLPPPGRGRLGGGQGKQFREHSKRTIARAQRLRRHSTDVEVMLWKYLCRRQMGYGFRRQHPIGSYIVDFACTKKKLVVELDGGQHAQAHAYDEKRTRYLQQQGYRVLRFWNHEVIENIEGVLRVIMRALQGTG